jgi:hypothetical protein
MDLRVLVCERRFLVYGLELPDVFSDKGKAIEHFYIQIAGASFTENVYPRERTLFSFLSSGIYIKEKAQDCDDGRWQNKYAVQ